MYYSKDYEELIFDSSLGSIMQKILFCFQNFNTYNCKTHTTNGPMEVT